MFLKIPHLLSIAEEWTSIHYYEVAAEANLQKESQCTGEKQFDKILRCVWLKWAKKNSDPYIDLVPISSLREHEQVVRCSNALSLLSSKKVEKGRWRITFLR